jgi:hypothetical protein
MHRNSRRLRRGPLCLAAQGDTGVLAEGPQPTAYTAITPEIYLRTRGTGIAQ